MASELATTQRTTPGPTPAWVWLLMVVLIGITVYSGYTALSKNVKLADAQTARDGLEGDKSRLEANVADLTTQLEAAKQTADQSTNALKQSRADTEAANGQISDLQAQVGDLDDKASALEKQVSDLQAKAAAADKLQAQVDKLKSDLTAANARADAAEKSAATQKAQVESLKAAQTQTQKKLEAALNDLAQAAKKVEAASPSQQ